ncbi:MAG: hypothetical protein VKJ64_03490, partial [Leptolyngbyaceae bacterium]|nr:hypothetical protein [Leptolyngbyaceae bacterium]
MVSTNNRMMSQSSHRPPLTYAATEPSSTQQMVAAASDATDAVYDADKTTKPLAAETSKPMPDILPGI